MFSLNKTKRRIIFWMAVCVFVISAPLIIAYSQGLRFDFVTREIVRVGAIALDSDPDGARIFLNGELYGDDTPAVIRGLLPGHLYYVKIIEDEHFAWEKTLTVEAQKITSARGVHLFPTNIDFVSIATSSSQITGMYPNARGETLFLVGDDGVSVFDVDLATTTEIAFPDTLRTLAIDNIEWHPDGNQLLFSRRTSNDLIWYVLNIEDNELTNLNQEYIRIRPEQSVLFPEELNATHIYFSRNGSDRLIVALEGRLYILNTAASTITELGIDNVAFLYSSGSRYFVVNGESTLLEIDINGNIVETYGTLGFIPERMALSPNGQRLFYDSNGRGEIIWLQNQELDWHREVGNIDIVFEEDDSPLFVWWHSSSAYILTLSGDSEFTAREIDIRDIQNTYSWNMNDFKAVVYFSQGSRLMAIDQNGIVETFEDF